MIFWCAILVGILFAVMGVRKSFYPMWAILFNILVSIYVGLMLTPTIIGIIPDIADSRYHHAACVAVLAIVIFIILQAIANSFIKSTSEVSFPKLFNSVGAGLLGFLSGYFLCSFVFLIICVMPFSRQPFMKTICSQTGPSKSVTTACNFINTLSLQSDNTSKVIEWLSTPLDELDDSPRKPDETEETD